MKTIELILPYLAPLNADFCFKRVFSKPHLAKAFFEDVLDVTIESILPLPRKNKITDDAAFVEFDYRCRMDNSYAVLDMQQWYKMDVVKRFYMYFCNGTSLQLETLPTLTIPLSNGKEVKTKNYLGVERSITLIWMVDDTLGFKDNMIDFALTP